MAESAQEFHRRAMAAADGEGRLPLPDQALWEILDEAQHVAARALADLGDVRI